MAYFVSDGRLFLSLFPFLLEAFGRAVDVGSDADGVDCEGEVILYSFARYTPTDFYV